MINTEHRTPNTCPRYISSILFFVLIISVCSYAQDSTEVDSLKQQILQVKTNQDSYGAFEEIADLYFSTHKYNEFVSFLDSLAKEKKELVPVADYFTALCRYYQLKYLEKTQNWDEYFASGNTYREAIVDFAQKAVDATSPKESLDLYAKLLLWKFHKDQQDVFTQDSLAALTSAALEYAKDAADFAPLKGVADEMSSYGERPKSKELYKIYLDKFLSSGAKGEDLLNSAKGFYKAGNTDLAELVYDAYIERITKSYPKDKLAAALIDIAKQFTYRDAGASDPLYAENIFKQAEAAGGKDIFDQGLMYLRAINLEKAKAYSEAKDIYADLLGRFPSGADADKASLKSGIIHTYILRDIKSGRSYFEKLAAETSVDAQVVSALYQLGLLAQWEGDNQKAKDYYGRLIDKAAGKFAQTVALAKDRVKEIDEAKPLDYNLQAFLDASLKEGNAAFDTTKLDLNYTPYKPKKNEDLNINSTVYTAESGCMQVEVQYLWSGDLGANKPTSAQSSFSARYSDEGTYLINLITVSASGIIDRNIAIIDVE